MRFGRAVIVGVFITALLISAGCGQVSEKQEPKKSEIQLGGTLVYGSLQEPNTLNPFLSEFIATAEVANLIFSGLVSMNDKGEWIADLAQEVPTLQNGGISADGLTVIYRLRPGVTWHDGTPFTSGDVKFTWEFVMNRQVNVVSREGYDKIAAVDTPDAQTVIIRFRQQYAPVLNLFSKVLPKHILGQSEDMNKASFNRSPVGTGPFKFKEWRIAEAIVLEANGAYFRGKPKLSGIIYKIMPEINILLTQLKAGEIDIVGNIGLAHYEQVKALSTVKTVVTPNLIWEHFDFNLDNPLFQDMRVRQAVALAIDRQAILNTALKNVASPASGDQSPISWAYNPSVKPAVRDVNAARELLAQAGWKQGPDGVFAKDGRRLSFSLATTAGNKVRETTAQMIVQQLKEAGIETEVRLIEPPAFFADILKNRRFETAMYAWVGGSDPDNLSLWNSKRIPAAGNGFEGLNYPGWRNPEIDMLTEQAARIIDLDQRRQRYFRIQEILVQEYPVIPLYFRANIDAVKAVVVNYRPNPTPAGNLWNAWEWALTVKK